ncbi:MAG TPA: hypothetical protein VEK57_30210 [Thermoanaerobaculia bacterium]|nr:hypothetical protein [Thermoanaerobaculia bacterium]
MPHTRPAKGVDVVCSTCIAPNTGKKTAGFNDPLVAYVGRYVDSANTRNVQNVGMRTVRAQRIRVSYPRKRVFVEYGEAIAGFPIAQFLANVAAKTLSGVGVMKTGATVKRLGDPVEIVAKPNTFFYAEAAGAEWEVVLQDTQETLTDFEVDDVGFVYPGTLSWGWGISKDANEFTDTRHMLTRVQVKDAPVVPQSVIFMKVGAVPYVVVSDGSVVSATAKSLLIYDTANRSKPVLKETRKGKVNGIRVWARHQPGQRVAVVNADGTLRVYAYDAFIANGAPLATQAAATGKTFRDLSFDDKGVLWAIESGTSPTAGNKLWQFTPSATGYTKVGHDVYGSAFAPEKVSARKGYVAVGGNAVGSKTELRLFKVTGGVPQFVDTNNFFYRYYHDKTPPAGFASAATYIPAYTSLYALHLLEWEKKLYLLYSANGLGDVYECRREVNRYFSPSATYSSDSVRMALYAYAPASRVTKTGAIL